MASKETLTQFGPTFQSKVLSSLLSDNQFIAQISDILLRFCNPLRKGYPHN